MDGAKAEVAGLSDYVFGRTRRRLDGLGDEEYLWEPVPGCWSARPREDGTWRLDNAVWPEAPPFTTIAWRLWHLVGCYGQAKNARWLGVPLDPGGGFEMHAPVPATAAGALACLDKAHGHWRAVLHSLSDEQLDGPLGPGREPFAEQKRAGYVLHMVDEFIHHGAELGLLRDLYRARAVAAGDDPLVTALLAGARAAVDDELAAAPGRLDEVRAACPDLVVRAVRNGRRAGVALLVELGFPVVDEPDEAVGATPLHYAAGAGDLEMVRLLIEGGADPTRRDRRFGADARGWAEYYGRREVADYLSSSA